MRHRLQSSCLRIESAAEPSAILMLTYLVLLCGAAELQHKVNHLGIQELTLLSPVEGAAATTAYVETFQSANQIPYPDNGRLLRMPHLDCWRICTRSCRALLRAAPICILQATSGVDSRREPLLCAHVKGLRLSLIRRAAHINCRGFQLARRSGGHRAAC